MMGLVFATLAHADMRSDSAPPRGGLVGNGGGTVVCRDDQHKIKSVELATLSLFPKQMCLC